VSQQETIRWNERSTVMSPALSRVTTRTPFTLLAADVTETWPVPGAEADPSPTAAPRQSLQETVQSVRCTQDCARIAPERPPRRPSAGGRPTA
jgi:hypothetical protein